MRVFEARMARGRGRTHRTFGLALAGLAALALAGCAGGYAGQSGQAPSGQRALASSPAALTVSQAAHRTLSLNARVGFVIHGSAAFGATDAPVLGLGSFAFPAGAGTEIVDLPEAAHQEHGNEHLIFLPTRAFLQPRGKTSGVLPPGKKWVSVALTGSESVSTNFPRFLSELEGLNPVLALAELAWGTTSAQPLSEQSVDHAPAERYRVSIDLPRALSGLQGPDRQVISQAIEEQLTGLASGGHDSGDASRLTFYAWVDRAGRLVQYQASLAGTGDGSALLRMNSFGGGIHVHPPGPSQAIGLGSLTPSGERENNGGGDSDGA